MKLTLLIFILLCINTTYSQKESDSIACYFDKGDKNELFLAINPSSLGVECEIKVVVKMKSDTIFKHKRLFFEIMDVTEQTGEFILSKKSILIDKEELLADSVIIEVKVKIKNTASSESRFFYLKLKCGDIENKQLVKVSSNNDISVIREGTMMGRMRMLKTNVNSYNKLKIGERDDLREKVSESQKSMKHKDKWFSKRFQVEGAKIKIDSVQLIISEGRINKMLVTTNKGTFESKGPISLTNYYNRRYYRLHYTGDNDSLTSSYIILRDFLNYYPETEKRYFPSNCKMVIKDTKKNNVLMTDGNPNTFFDARVYTDLKALNGEGNGLIQTEIKAKFIFNSNSFGRTSFTMLQFLKMGLSLSKFDSKYDTLNIRSYDDTITRIRTLNLVQNSNSSFKIELDLFRISAVHHGFISVGHNLYHTKTRDSLGVVKRVFTPVFYSTIGGVIFASDWLKADFKMPINFSYNYDQQFMRSIRKWEIFIAPEIEISIKIGNKDTNSAVNKKASAFARIRYFDLLNVRGGNFWQIQTGIEVPVSTLFKK